MQDLYIPIYALRSHQLFSSKSYLPSLFEALLTFDVSSNSFTYPLFEALLHRFDIKSSIILGRKSTSELIWSGFYEKGATTRKGHELMKAHALFDPIYRFCTLPLCCLLLNPAFISRILIAAHQVILRQRLNFGYSLLKINPRLAVLRVVYLARLFVSPIPTPPQNP